MLQDSYRPSSKKFYIQDVVTDDYVRPMFRKFAAEVSHDKKAEELKAEILMGIYKSCNDLIISFMRIHNSEGVMAFLS